MHSFSSLQRLLQLPVWFEPCREAFSHITHTIYCISLSLPLHRAVSLPLLPNHKCEPSFFFVFILYCKAGSELPCCWPSSLQADGCFSAPHGQHSGDVGCALRRKRLSICFSNCSPPPPSSHHHVFRTQSPSTPPSPTNTTPPHLHGNNLMPLIIRPGLIVKLIADAYIIADAYMSQHTRSL